MSKKRKVYSGTIPVVPSHQIHLNINHLERGQYTLKIMHQNKVIKQTTFRKK